MSVEGIRKTDVKVTDTVKYIGVDDTTIDIFESQYPVEDGISYNSYIIIDEKIAIMDTVDARGGDEWLERVEEALAGKEPSYLIVSHLEPDHAACIKMLTDKYPKTIIIGSAKTQAMLPQFFDLQGIEVKCVAEGEELNLGSHTLQFFMAPMVHWPEVMVTYEKSEKILFSADGFGTFGAICSDKEWIADATHYYFNIVGKYGTSVQALLKKASTLDISIIAPLHGPVLTDDLSYYIEKYDAWSSYKPEKNGIFVAYASIHGNTKAAALKFAEDLEKSGEIVETMDLTREDITEAVEKCFMYDRIILACATYDGGLFPPMEDLIYHLEMKNFQNRKIGLIENGSWGPLAAKKMSERLSALKDITICPTVVTIKSVMKPENADAFEALKKEISH